ncbi:hypothetical protein AX14_011716 [Amanita brunnescens Koide BX004]|nr:hypothetical protein AX14_011716 [Amanita brunnescens Koide BX004]
MSRVFQPKLSNPLHADSPSVQSAPSPPLRPILKTPVALPRGLHVRWSDPLCKVKTFLTPPQETTPAHDAWEPNYMLVPDATTVPGPSTSLHDAMDQDESPTVTPMYSPASLEDITRVNLLYLMASKGIIFVPHATPHIPIPFASYTNTTQPSNSGFVSTRPSHTNRDDIENEPVTTTDDSSSSYMTEDDSILQSHFPSSHTSRNSKRHHIVLTQSLKTNTPLFPKFKPKPPLTKPRIFEWANGLNRLWYLLEQGKYSQSDHDQLRSLLRSISNEKDRPGLGLTWLKDTKLIEILKKLKKDKRLQEFDPPRVLRSELRLRFERQTPWQPPPALTSATESTPILTISMSLSTGPELALKTDQFSLIHEPRSKLNLIKPRIIASGYTLCDSAEMEKNPESFRSSLDTQKHVTVVNNVTRPAGT